MRKKMIFVVLLYGMLCATAFICLVSFPTILTKKKKSPEQGNTHNQKGKVTQKFNDLP